MLLNQIFLSQATPEDEFPAYFDEDNKPMYIAVFSIWYMHWLILKFKHNYNMLCLTLSKTAMIET